MSEFTHAQFVGADDHYGVRRNDDYDLNYGPTPPGVGWLAFAATMMALIGGLYMVAGLVTLFESHYYEVNTAVLAVDQSWTTLGWTQLILGVIVLGAGLALLRGYMWARIVAVVFAGLTVIQNFLTMAASPVWNLILIALAVLVIHSVIVHGREAAEA
jgi:hypothetical protein